MNNNVNNLDPNNNLNPNNNAGLNNNANLVNNVNSNNNNMGLNNNANLINNTNPSNNIEQLEVDNSNKEKIQEKEAPKEQFVIMSKKKSKELEQAKREERAKKENYVPVPVKKSKYVFMIIFFIFAFCLVYFLPDLNEFLSVRQAKKNQENMPAITEGTLICKKDDVYDVFDFNYEYKFAFSDSKLDDLNYERVVRGDETLDFKKLNDMYDKCKVLEQNVLELDGVKVYCNLSNDGIFVERQNLDFNALNRDLIIPSYAEAGGIFPEFNKGEDISKIEKDMNASGYTCERLGN